AAASEREMAPPPLRGAALALALAAGWPPPAGAFIEELFGQMGGGGQQFHFEMGGGGQRRKRKQPKWPKGTPTKISKKMAWLKGTESGTGTTGETCSSRRTTATSRRPRRTARAASASGLRRTDGKVYILWGEAGLHEMDLVGKAPEEQDPQKMAGLKMRGLRKSDQSACSAVFRRVFDHEAAELDKDLYGILGLQDDADEGDIKKVYRKLSIKYHPDKNPDEESKKKFAEVRDAYEILNDPDKKILYDTGGMEAVKKFEKNEVERGDDFGTSVTVRLEDLYSSGVHKASIRRRVVCRGCRTKPDSPKCKGCQRCPNEVRMVNRQVGPGMFMQQQEEVQSKEKCKDRESTPLDVQIEKGMRNGETVKFERMAEQRPGIIPGGVVFTLKTAKHSKFERRGDDLHVAIKVSLREALLGFQQTIRHLDGHTVEVGTESVTRPFQMIRGEGMPQRDDPATFGDLYVKVEVLLPPALTDDQRQAVEGMFGPAPSRPEL
ncbi:unnamed protein product, partial [Prorocentrum cordatum]